MEIVIENPTTDVTTTLTSPINPNFPTNPGNPGHNRPYRAAYVSNVDGTSPTIEYYSTLQHPRPRSRLISPEPDFDSTIPQVPTTVRRVDRSGLLEIAELEPSRNTSRTRNLTGSDNNNHSGTLTRRIDRSGLLEAVPEVPDQCQGWKSPEKSASTSNDDRHGRSSIDRRLTGAEIVGKNDSQLQQNRQQSTSPRNSRSPIDPTNLSSLHRRSSEILPTPEDCRNIGENRTIVPSPTNVRSSIVNSLTLPSSVSSPYLRRYPGGNSPTFTNLERPIPVIIGNTTVVNCEETRNKNKNSYARLSSPVGTKFLPIDDVSSRNRQSYVDLTGASYTRSTSTSPNTISRTIVDSNVTNTTDSDNSRDKRQQPDCLGRLSPRTKNDVTSALTMSAIPDVIEAHGSRNHGRDDNDGNEKNGPEGERAEAEGCEHSAGSSHEETRVSFKASNKILHNDNIQTLRVIILSEQL